jgi:hypothetical protein
MEISEVIQEGSDDNVGRREMLNKLIKERRFSEVRKQVFGKGVLDMLESGE